MMVITQLNIFTTERPIRIPEKHNYTNINSVSSLRNRCTVVKQIIQLVNPNNHNVFNNSSIVYPLFYWLGTQRFLTVDWSDGGKRFLEWAVISWTVTIIKQTFRKVQLSINKQIHKRPEP